MDLMIGWWKKLWKVWRERFSGVSRVQGEFPFSRHDSKYKDFALHIAIA